MDSKQVFKDNWKGITQGLGIIVILVSIIHLLGLVWWQIILLIIGFQTGVQLYKKFKHGRKFSFKQFFKSAVQVTILVSLITLMNQWAWAGLATILFTIALYKLIVRRDTYKWAIEQVSSAIWGQSLFEKYNIQTKNIILVCALLVSIIGSIVWAILDFSIFPLMLLGISIILTYRLVY